MADFIITGGTNSGTLNFPKTDRHATPPGTDPTKIISGSEWNSLCQAAVDIRTNIISGSIFGFGTRYANAGSIPSIPGHSKATGDYFWIDTDAELNFHKRDNTDHQMVTKDVFNRIGLNVLVASGTVHAYSDGTDARMLILQQANVSSIKNTAEFFREVTNHKIRIGQFQNATDGWVPANAMIVEVFDGSTTRNVMHADVGGTRITLGHTTSSPQLRVGINTITPLKRLDINGDLRVAQTSSFEDSVYVTGALGVTGSSDVIGPLSASSVSAGGARLQPLNNIINGNFQFWQRGVTPVVQNTSSPTRTFHSDRWYSYTLKFGAPDTQFTTSKQTSSLPNDYCVRIKCDTSSGIFTDNWGLIVQEVDRDLVKLMRGKRVTLTAKLRTGSSFSDFITAYIVENTGSSTQNLTTFGGSNELSANFISTGLTTSFKKFSVTSANPVSSIANGVAIYFGYVIQGGHPGTADDYIDVSEVMLTIGESVPELYEMTGQSEAGEFNLCQRYYEKSYEQDTAPGTSTSSGYHVTNVLAITANDTDAWFVGANPRFLADKRVAPTVSLWDTDGSSGQWQLGGDYLSTSAIALSTKGFVIANNTGGPVTPTAGYAFGQWIADAEI